ncbi:nucleotidyltransferase domain-containing protein [Patescibacteria group bacterium]|nr:nucleotidyltransferase domain-containing protein [Patescibacteria group bacterium]
MTTINMDILRISKSKTRKKILKLFFTDIDKKYYLRELEKKLEISVGNIRRELLSLEKIGLFKKEKKGNQLYYFLNKKTPLFEEIKKIVSKTIGIEARIEKGLKKIKNIKISFIFGSFAKQKEDQFSDIDLMIIGNPDENILIKNISLIETYLSREINYVIFSQQDFRKKSKESVFLEDIISNPKIFIIGNQNEFEKIIR